MLSAVLASIVLSQPAYQGVTKDYTKETKPEFDRRMEWFRQARFGMFIHWGLYSIPAGSWKGKDYPGIAEWILHNAQIPVSEYEPLKAQFNPVNFDAKRWVQIAKDAGMKYIVITSKHHEGFAMWPSKIGDWNIGHTQFKRDPLKELAEECKKAGLKLCFYHSIMDWHHPDFMPRESYDKRPTTGADMNRYVGVLKGQLKELLTNYGPIGILWFDGEWRGWNHERGVDLYNYVRSLQPKIIINNRVDVGRGGMAGMTTEGHVGDYGTPEQEIPARGISTDWESCMTMNNSWGFDAKDKNWKSPETLIFNLVDCASKGGNYLLNVGPTSLGEIPNPSIERLATVGKWIKVNGEAVYGTKASPFAKQFSWGRVTQKGNSLYLTVFDKSASEVVLPGLLTEVKSARILGTKQNLWLSKKGNDWSVKLPPSTEAGVDQIRVVRVDLAGKAKVDAAELSLSQQANGEMIFDASDAELTGPLQFEAGEKNAIGFWTRPEGEAKWKMAVKTPGKYRVLVTQACPTDTAGSTYELSLGSASLGGTVEPTGSWASFKTIEIGQISVERAGVLTLTVKARKMKGEALMNLRRVQLKPI